ncbi:MAG: dTMP kinase [Candidatus Competibacterales bacterium]
MRGRFITFEGLDGGGKSTQSARLEEYLQSRGLTVVTTREPGGTPGGEALRDLLLDPAGPMPGVDAELLMLFAARAEHLQRVIEPALAAGKWVLCDRFTDATYAYQGGGRGVAWSRIAILETWVLGDVRPDLTVWLDLPVAAARRRIAGRDRFEGQDGDFFQRVHAAYQRLSQRYPQRIRMVADPQGVRTADDIATEVAALVAPWLA